VSLWESKWWVRVQTLRMGMNFHRLLTAYAYIPSKQNWWKGDDSPVIFTEDIR
jgi:hypothetical protein